MPATASSGVEMSRTIGSTRPTSAAASTTEPTIKRVTVLPMTFAACFLSPAPTDRPMQTVVPIATPTNITVIICIT